MASPTCNPGGRTDFEVGFLDSLLLSPSASDPVLFEQTETGRHHGAGSNPKLVQMPLVSFASASTHECQGSSFITSEARSPILEPSSATTTRETQVSSHDIERQGFVILRCFTEVVETLMKARKCSTNSIYNRV